MARVIQNMIFYYEHSPEGTQLRRTGTLPKSLIDFFEPLMGKLDLKEEGDFSFGFGTFSLHHLFYFALKTSETPILIIGKLDSFYDFDPRSVLLSLITSLKTYFREQEQDLSITIPPLFENKTGLEDQPVCAFLEALIKKSSLILPSLNQVESLIAYFTINDNVPIIHVSGVGLCYNSTIIANKLEWVHTSLGVINPNKRCSEYISTITSINKLVETQPSITKLAILNLSQALLLLYLGKKTEFKKIGKERIELSLNVIKKQATSALIPALIVLLQGFFEKAIVEGDEIPYYFGQAIVELAVKGEMNEEIRVVNAEYAGMLQKNLPLHLKQLYFNAIIDNSLFVSTTDTISALETTWDLFREDPQLKPVYLEKLQAVLKLLPESPELYNNLVNLFLTIGEYKQAIDAKLNAANYDIIKKGLLLDDVIDLLQWTLNLRVPDPSLKTPLFDFVLAKFFDKSFSIEQLTNIYSHLLKLAKDTLPSDLMKNFLQSTLLYLGKRRVQDQFTFLKSLDDYLSDDIEQFYYIILEIKLRTYKVSLMTNNIAEASRASVSLLNTIDFETEDAKETFKQLVIDMLELALLYAQHEITTTLIQRARNIIEEQALDVKISELVNQAMKKTIDNYGSDGVYAPYFISLIKDLLQEPETQQFPKTVNELLSLGLLVSLADNNAKAYYEFFLLAQTFKLREDTMNFIEFTIKSIQELVSIGGIEQAKKIIHDISEGILEAEMLQVFFRKLLDLPHDLVQILLTPTEIARIRRELARLQSRILQNEEGLEHYIKGVTELQLRKEYELVRDMAIEGIKYAIEKNQKDKLPLFLTPLQESFQINFNTYSRIKSDAIYFDLIKDLRELTQLLYKEKEYQLLLDMILKLAKVEITIAQKESNPKLTVLHSYRCICTLKEFLLTTVSLGLPISEDVQEQVWTEVKNAYLLLIEKNRYHLNTLPRLLAHFILATRIRSALPLYYNEFSLSQQILPKRVFKTKSLDNLLAIYEGMISLVALLPSLPSEDVELFKSSLIRLITKILNEINNPLLSTKLTESLALIKTQARGEMSVSKEQLLVLRDALVTEVIKS